MFEFLTISDIVRDNSLVIKDSEYGQELNLIQNIEVTGEQLAFKEKAKKHLEQIAYEKMALIQKDAAGYYIASNQDLKVLEKEINLEGSEIGDLKISGSLYAQEYIVTSSITSMSVIQASGSTIFGDTNDDTHTFTGDIVSSGNLHVRGMMSSSGDLILGGTSAGNPHFSASQGNLELSGSAQAYLEVAGNISASGYYYGDGSQLTGVLSGQWYADNQATPTYLTASVPIHTNDLNVSGSLTVSQSDIKIYRDNRIDFNADHHPSRTFISASGTEEDLYIRADNNLELDADSKINLKGNTYITGIISGSQNLSIRGNQLADSFARIHLHNDGGQTGTHHVSLPGITLSSGSSKIVLGLC